MILVGTKNIARLPKQYIERTLTVALKSIHVIAIISIFG